MIASYTILNTPDNLVRMGTAPFVIKYSVDGRTNFEYERRAKLFYKTEVEADKAGKRYLRKMKKDGFDI